MAKKGGIRRFFKKKLPEEKRSEATRKAREKVEKATEELNAENSVNEELKKNFLQEERKQREKIAEEREAEKTEKAEKAKAAKAARISITLNNVTYMDEKTNKLKNIDFNLPIEGKVSIIGTGKIDNLRRLDDFMKGREFGSENTPNMKGGYKNKSLRKRKIKNNKTRKNK